jgi:hypothetical protein
VLVALHGEVFDGIEIFGIIKETGVDDDGLVEFSANYFDFPLYCDKSFAFYQALGDRQVGWAALLSPLSVLGILCDAFQRIRRKSIDGTSRGEGFVQGGIIIFRRDGQPGCMYQEQTGVDLQIADLVGALNLVRNE